LAEWESMIYAARDVDRDSGVATSGAPAPMTGVQLTDGVILLRPMTPADAATHLAGEDEPTARFLSGGRSTIETVTAWIERCRLSWETNGPVRAFGIREKATGDLVGMVEANLAAADYRDSVTNISYGLYPAARGRGYATRAVRLVVRYLVEKTAANIAVIQTHPENSASARVALRAAFRPLGDRIASDGDRMVVFAVGLRPEVGELALTDVCRR